LADVTAVEEVIEIRIVRSWDAGEIEHLYRAGGWWKDEYDPAGICPLIKGSHIFAVAVNTTTGRAVGMGRVISDGCSDGYIQDVIVLPEYRGRKVGSLIINALIERGRDAGLTWIGLIAEPGNDLFYASLGFAPMEGYVPMILRRDP
jgi:ribosomal protein S18 acetylase RimI-like enzyme